MAEDPQKDEHVEELLSQLQGIFGQLSQSDVKKSKDAAPPKMSIPETPLQKADPAFVVPSPEPAQEPTPKPAEAATPSATQAPVAISAPIESPTPMPAPPNPVLETSAPKEDP